MLNKRSHTPKLRITVVLCQNLLNATRCYCSSRTKNVVKRIIFKIARDNNMNNDPNDWDNLNDDSNDWDFKQQELSQKANSEVTELEALRCELRELKEEIKNKPQITSGDIAAGVARGIMYVIGTFVMLYLALVFIIFLVSAVTSGINNSPRPSVTSPSP